MLRVLGLFANFAKRIGLAKAARTAANAPSQQDLAEFGERLLQRRKGENRVVDNLPGLFHEMAEGIETADPIARPRKKRKRSKGKRSRGRTRARMAYRALRRRFSPARRSAGRPPMPRPSRMGGSPTSPSAPSSAGSSVFGQNNPFDRMPFDNIQSSGFYTNPFHTNADSGDPDQAALRMRQFGSQLTLAATNLGGFNRVLGVSATVAGGFINTLRAIHGAASTQVASQSRIAQYSGASSLALSNLNVNRLFRDMEFGKHTQRSFVDLTKALDRLERAMHPFEAAFTNLLNHILSLLSNVAAKFLEATSFVANAVNAAAPFIGGGVKTAGAIFTDPIGWFRQTSMAGDIALELAYAGLFEGEESADEKFKGKKTGYIKREAWERIKRVMGIDHPIVGMAKHHQYELDLGVAYDDKLNEKLGRRNMTDAEKKEYKRLMQESLDAANAATHLRDPHTGTLIDPLVHMKPDERRRHEINRQTEEFIKRHELEPQIATAIAASGLQQSHGPREDVLQQAMTQQLLMLSIHEKTAPKPGIPRQPTKNGVGQPPVPSNPTPQK